ncbi:MAG: MBL fold metallo-hydrolase [Desulfobacteraceae bacterium]|nr:MBL fold metallo-hydrolase [Desulfobacteraceae bacterium]MBC2755022.1 MBL fold metallo-hydrolase [Desulfobacteraceae bacterium]
MSKKNKQNILLLISSMLLGVFSDTPGFAAPGYKGPVTDHFDGEKFYNRVDSDVGLIDFFRFSLPFNFIKEDWPDWIDSTPRKISQPRQTGDEISVTFINHSTVLIQVDGVNILTDPIFTQRTSSLSWIGPKRVRNPGVNIEDLPPLDVILVTHNHYDHLDIESLQLLQAQNPEKQPPLILSGLGNGLLFKDSQLTDFKDLDWEQLFQFKNIEFVFTETRHRSGRGITDQNKTLWGGFVIKTRLGNIYFAGDTGYGPHFKNARKTHGGFILSLLPIGAYEPRWFMKIAHLNPEEAVSAHMDLNAQKSMGIHFGTFQLTYESIDQPIMDLKKALKDKQIPETDFFVPEFGKTHILKP